MQTDTALSFSASTKTTLRLFVLHASVIKNLSEEMKLDLIGGMTSVELTLGTFLTQKIGNVASSEFAAFRAFRQLLFFEPSNTSTKHFPDLPGPVILTYSALRANLNLPYGNSELEWVSWMQQRSSREAMIALKDELGKQDFGPWKCLAEESLKEF